ncbi:hypothetical protein GCM10007424_11800 [Flavobacterium suaedae]|uniref:DUF3828 domain-containing protein n=1 Tax=Flavobacterium suaedae TaxID=1767027 RepID=A0ABQ1JNH0_9FLAO|nr:hypothetical protein [Flavobacterium suaedae]GGB73534.1 hypothetical protein GCM10007424_11800 [Flavobacterium suaedae]
MKFKAFLAVICITILQSCSNSTETLTNNQIDASLRETIKRKNDSLFDALSNSNMKALKALGSDDFNKHLRSRIESTVWAFRRGYLKEDNTEIYKEYYCKGTISKNMLIEDEENKYSITFSNTQPEAYVSLLKSKYGKMEDYLITVIYELVDGKWKLSNVETGLLGHFDKNAQDYFEIAKQKEKEGFLIDAAFNCDMAASFLEPAGDMLTYDNEERIEFYKNQWRKTLSEKYKFPYVLRNVESQPAIMGIEPIKTVKGVYPKISYQTPIHLDETEFLEMELAEIKKEIKKAIPDLDFSTDIIYYRAYNNSGSVPYYEHIHKKKN